MMVFTRMSSICYFNKSTSWPSNFNR